MGLQGRTHARARAHTHTHTHTHTHVQDNVLYRHKYTYLFLHSIFLKANKCTNSNTIEQITKHTSYQVPTPTCFGNTVPSSGNFPATKVRRSNLKIKTYSTSPEYFSLCFLFFSFTIVWHWLRCTDWCDSGLFRTSFECRKMHYYKKSQCNNYFIIASLKKQQNTLPNSSPNSFLVLSITSLFN